MVLDIRCDCGQSLGATGEHTRRLHARKLPMIVDHTIEEPLLCAVCGCVWHEEQAPEEKCPEATCPCHNRYWDQTDELVKRYLWGDR